MRKPLFPFYLPDHRAHAIAEKDPMFMLELEKRGKYARITSLSIYGEVTANKVLHLTATVSTDDGFCLIGNDRFWDKIIALPDADFDRIVSRELESRARAEIAAEEEAKYEKRVKARMADIRAEIDQCT